jgi:hypothetical protein
MNPDDKNQYEYQTTKDAIQSLFKSIKKKEIDMDEKYILKDKELKEIYEKKLADKEKELESKYEKKYTELERYYKEREQNIKALL